MVFSVILQLPLRTDRRLVSSGFTKDIICSCCIWEMQFYGIGLHALFFFKTIIVPHCFSVQKNWICPHNFLQLTILMVLPEDNKKSQWFSSVFIKTVSRSDLHSSTTTSRNRKHSITFRMRGKRRLSLSDLQSRAGKAVKSRTGILCCRNCRKLSHI